MNLKNILALLLLITVATGCFAAGGFMGKQHNIFHRNNNWAPVNTVTNK